MGKYIALLLGVGALLGTFVLVPFLFAKLLTMGMRNDTYTELAQYKKMLRELPRGVAAHFPKSIPNDPGRVRLHFKSLHFGQANMDAAELWMKVERAEIEELYADFEQRQDACYILKTRDAMSDQRWVNARRTDEKLENLWGFYTPVQDDPSTTATAHYQDSGSYLTTDYVIFTLPKESWGWKHGVAINRKEGIIIYFAQSVIAT